jgi:hypothetical protein
MTLCIICSRHHPVRALLTPCQLCVDCVVDVWGCLGVSKSCWCIFNFSRLRHGNPNDVARMTSGVPKDEAPPGPEISMNLLWGTHSPDPASQGFYLPAPNLTFARFSVRCTLSVNWPLLLPSTYASSIALLCRTYV